MADPHPYENVSVLVIEDMASVRKLIKNMLIQLGIRAVFEAGDGKAGLEETIRTCPTMVLCDVHMEPVDGRAYLKFLRNHPTRTIATTPVIMLTSDSSKDTVLFAKEHHANGYLVKPVSLNHLKSRIDAVLRGTAPG
jgi:two-component system chemotaxis response regulator CheY